MTEGNALAGSVAAIEHWEEGRTICLMLEGKCKMDAIVKAIGSVLAGLHPVTNAIFTGVMTYRNEIEMRFVKNVIVGVNERVYKLEQKIDKEYIKSDDYMNFLYKTLM